MYIELIFPNALIKTKLKLAACLFLSLICPQLDLIVQHGNPAFLVPYERYKQTVHSSFAREKQQTSR